MTRTGSRRAGPCIHRASDSEPGGGEGTCPIGEILSPLNRQIITKDKIIIYSFNHILIAYRQLPCV